MVLCPHDQDCSLEPTRRIRALPARTGWEDRGYLRPSCRPPLPLPRSAPGLALERIPWLAFSGCAPPPLSIRPARVLCGPS